MQARSPEPVRHVRGRDDLAVNGSMNADDLEVLFNRRGNCINNNLLVRFEKP
jgi:hypothetical protein